MTCTLTHQPYGVNDGQRVRALGHAEEAHAKGVGQEAVRWSSRGSDSFLNLVGRDMVCGVAVEVVVTQVSAHEIGHDRRDLCGYHGH